MQRVIRRVSPTFPPSRKIQVLITADLPSVSEIVFFCLEPIPRLTESSWLPCWQLSPEHPTTESVANQDKFFRSLPDTEQQVEAGWPITVSTLLQIYEVSMSKLVQGLDREGVYEALVVEIPSRRRADVGDETEERPRPG